MAVWPSNLPTAPMTGWTETPGVSVIRTNTDAGPAKLRRRFTSAPSAFSLQFALYGDGSKTAEEKATILIGFYENSVDDGTQPGTAGGVEKITGLPHPRDDSSVSFRFLAPPVVTQTAVNLYRASIRLELVA